MNHAIKINRAREKSTVPASVMASVSSAQLAELLDAIHSHSEESKSIAERDAIDEGAIWDERRGVMREIQ